MQPATSKQSPQTPALSVIDITKKYKVAGGYEVPALNGISLELHPGQMLGLFGPNGAGKTTLVRIVAGLLSTDSGEVSWGVPDGRSALGYVSQKGGLQYGLTCREEMSFQAQCFGQSERLARKNVDAVAGMLRCEHLMDWDVGRLSGGQRRIVEIGLALVSRPAVVLLDEPTLGLDPATRLSLWQTVETARSETGAAFLVTTHYIDEVAEHLSNVSVMSHGILVASGSPQDIRDRFAVGAVKVAVARGTESRAVSLLAGFPGITQGCGELLIPSKRPNRDAAFATGVLAGNGIPVHSINIQEATLEAAFLAITADRGKDCPE